MKRHLNFFLITLLFMVHSARAQNSYGTISWFNEMSGIYYPASGGIVQQGPDYGCATLNSRPVWILFTTCGPGLSGTFNFTRSETSMGNPPNYDTSSFAIWGPFDDTTGAFNHLTSSNLIYCFNQEWNYYNPMVLTLESKKIYYMCITNSDSVQSISMTLFATNNNGVFMDSGTCSICHGHSNYMNQHICIVTVDSATNKNKVVWSPEDPHMNEYIIYRQSSAYGVYDSIGLVGMDQPSYFIDDSSDPLIKSYGYRMGTIDSCGMQHETNYDVTTMHLTTSIGLNGEVNLVWNAYGGYPYPGYLTFYIFRSLNNGPYEAIDSIASNTTTYTDLNPPAGDLHYKVGILMPACYQGNDTYTYSNRSSTTLVGIESAVLPEGVSLFPNPSHDKATLQLGSLSGKVNAISIYSITGERILNSYEVDGSDLTIPTSNIAPGIYVLNISSDGMIYRMRLAIQ